MVDVMRKYYIDNLRSMAVILLFPYHVFMIYNNWGENFYIKGVSNIYLSNFIVLVWPWFMPLLFVLAGISTAYALEKRTIIEYIKERVLRLFIPVVFGILITIPSMSFIADRFHNRYVGNYFQHYIIFFTKITDLSGYDGGFTPGHLWFILYLFIISIMAIPIITFTRKRNLYVEKVNIIVLILLFLIPLFGQLILDISGKSLGEYFCFFIIGYYLLSNENIIEKTEKYWYIIFLLFFGCMTIIFTVFNEVVILDNLLLEIVLGMYAYTGVLSFILVGKKCLNETNALSEYLSKSSFSVYFFHQTWIIIIGYFIFRIFNNIIIQLIFILIVSIILTFGSYELCKKNKITRFLFGIKK